MSATDFTSAGRVVSLLDPDEYGAGALAGNEIDTKGWRWLHVSIMTGTVAGTSSVAVQSSTTSGGSFTTITGASFSIEAADDNTVLHMQIDLEQQSQFIKLSGTAGGTSDLAIVGVLYGCQNTAEYIDMSSGGADELVATILT